MAQGLGRESKEHPCEKKQKDCDEKKLSVKSSSRDGRVMGSRRIFAPQFKLQVLDSYRQDEDCKGNQRATARKYGIHRRQIQKWLQVEASLRTSVVEVAPAGEPTALNLSSAAGRQRDDSGDSARTGRESEPLARLSPVKLEPEPGAERDSDEESSNSMEALDFSCAALSKRRSFSLQFKLEVLDAFHADRMCHGNQRATARKFSINRRQVQKWLGQECELRGEAAFRGGLYRQRLGRWLEGSPAADVTSSSNSQCWDLSGPRKRIHEPEPEPRGFKRWAATPAAEDDVQETALCLVKVERHRDEVSSSADALLCRPQPLLPPPHSSGWFVPPLVYPPTYQPLDLKLETGMDCCCGPKWCQDITNLRALNMFR